mmetsp:Transcript_12955/g.26280  ORF Transcript_12955/g.26280 Transcript_12955/m.26280 type:complete len:94 (-) Transcript_12955:767-1048(-)
MQHMPVSSSSTDLDACDDAQLEVHRNFVEGGAGKLFDRGSNGGASMSCKYVKSLQGHSFSKTLTLTSDEIGDDLHLRFLWQGETCRPSTDFIR